MIHRAVVYDSTRVDRLVCHGGNNGSARKAFNNQGLTDGKALSIPEGRPELGGVGGEAGAVPAVKPGSETDGEAHSSTGDRIEAVGGEVPPGMDDDTAVTEFPTSPLHGIEMNGGARGASRRVVRGLSADQVSPWPIREL